MSYAPLNYENINLIEGGFTPSTVKVNSRAFDFWSRALFQRACSVIDFKLPEDWDGDIRDFFYYCMFRYGHVAVFNYEKFGLSFQPCSLSGIDFYYRPTTATISNQAMKSSDSVFTIGDTCEILKLCPDYSGIWDIIEYYAEKLALLDTSLNTAIINSKFAFILGAKNKAAGEALKKILDLINSGEPAVIADRQLKNDPNDKDNPFQFLDLGITKERYIVPLLLTDFTTILHNFDTEVGIPTLPIEKKERMITDEANMRSVDAVSRSKIWENTFNSSAKIVNKHFNCNISAELENEPDEKEGEAYVKTDNARNV